MCGGRTRREMGKFMRCSKLWPVVVWAILVASSGFGVVAQSSMDAPGQPPPLPALEFSDKNRPVAVKNIALSLKWTYSYPGNVSYEEYTKIYSKLVHKGRVLVQEERDIADRFGFILEGKSADFVIDASGWQAIDLFISYTPDFNVSNSATRDQWYVPGALTLLPPIVVIAFAIVTKEVFYSLYLGIFFAAFIVKQYNPFAAFLTTCDTYIVESIGQVSHAYVILFTWLLSGLIAAITKSGGSFGIADVFSKFAKTRMSVQMVILFLGVVIFFDANANSLLLGNTMRVVSDRMMISREKLAFLVDATTAPVASIAPISSWIGFEVGLIQQQLENLQDNGVDVSTLPSAYIIFVQTVPSRYYPIFMLVFQFLSILFRREWGPMLLAERRAFDEGKLIADDAKIRNEEENKSLLPKPNTPLCWWNGFVPVILVIVLVMSSIILTGRAKTIEMQKEAIALGLPPPPLNAQALFGNGDANASLTYASFFTMLFAWVMYRFQYVLDGRIVLPFKHWIKCRASPGQPLQTLGESLEVMISGIKQIFEPILILIFAWAVGAAITDSGAGLFFSSALSSSLDPELLPALTFLIAAIISGCTGTSWGTMTILFPLVVPASYNRVDTSDQRIFILTVSAILAGAIFGDHLAPISDTTILSAVASGCDLMHHTITQAPYGVLVAVVSMLLGYLPVGYNLYPNWGGILIGSLGILLLVIFFAVRVDHPKRKLDVLTNVCVWIAGKLRVDKDGEEGDPEAEKYIHVYNPEDELTYVDILRPKTFFNWNTWRRRKQPADTNLDDVGKTEQESKSDQADDDTVSTLEDVDIVPIESTDRTGDDDGRKTA